MTLLELNKENFKNEVKDKGSNKVVAVYFWAPGCERCKDLDSDIEMLAEEYDNKGVKFGKLDIQKDPEVMDNFWIGDVPAIVYFKGGELVEAIVGEITKPDIAKMLDKVLEKH